MRVLYGEEEEKRMSEWIVSAEDIECLVNGLFAVGQKLVRCKDCKHWLGIEEESPTIAPCDAYDGDTLFTKIIMTSPNGFCYKGDRREENEYI